MFNSKKISQLEQQVKRLDERLLAIEKHPIECFAVGNSVPENTYIAMFSTQIEAIKEYLKLDIVWNWADDPNIAPPEHPKIRVWKAVKKSKKKH